MPNANPDCPCSCATTVLTVKRGDACSLPVIVKLNDTALVAADLELIEEIEFTFGEEGIRKLYPKDAIFDDGQFLVPLTQKDTFAFEDGLTALDVRIQFLQSGNVIGTTAHPRVRVVDSFSEVIL